MVEEDKCAIVHLGKIVQTMPPQYLQSDQKRHLGITDGRSLKSLA